MRLAAFTILFFICLCHATCTSTGVSKGITPPDDTIDSITAGIPADSTAHTVSVAMTGDIMMGTSYPEHKLPPANGKGLFADAGDILRHADIAVGNLEGVLCDSAENRKKKSDNHYSFCTPTSFAPRLKEAGYDFLSLANNHSLDFGMPGLKSTERVLRHLGIKYAGVAGRVHYAVIDKDSTKFGLCAFGHNGHTLRHQDLPTVKSVINELRKRSDIIIVSFHGGAEGNASLHLPYGKEKYLSEDRGSLRGFARFCIDNGADLVFGHGPHVPRCIELYKGRLIAYSLGNFCTPYGINITGPSGYAPVIVARLNRNGEFISGRIHSFIQARGRGPRKDYTNAATRLIRNLTDSDIPDSRLRIDKDGEIRRK